DAAREWAYDRESHIGRLDKGLDEANTKVWMVVDMKKDWKVNYPFQVDRKLLLKRYDEKRFCANI
ncbi:MAG: hypothetical protein GY774_19440, partial [Planctomycetes bacterium]|nr:hypothetical protein [Planctomycetota bacterium]